jgi:branched-chain amino acid transport system substrate-binding protein
VAAGSAFCQRGRRCDRITAHAVNQPGENRERCLIAIKDYLARHKASAANGAEPDRWASAVTYASLQMLQQAIERVGKVDRAAVIKDLQTGTFDTVIGKVKLENNMPTRYWWVGQWQDGEFYGIAPAKNEGARTAIVPKPAWVAP